MPDKKLWCADATDPDDLPSKLGMIEIAGDSAKGVNIQPGYNGNAAYNAARDGEIVAVPPPGANDDAGVACAVFWNWAMRPGWQRWRPNYRYAEIGDIDYDADTCDVTLDDNFATDKVEGVDRSINPDDNVLAGVPIEYMNCNAAAFTIGDRVIVKFENYSWDSPKVIGFESNPKGCNLYIVVKLGSDCTVWDVREDKIAEDVKLNSGDDATFPTAYSTITNWIAERKQIIAEPLFTEETINGTVPSYEVSDIGDGASETHGECEHGDPNDFWQIQVNDVHMVGSGNDENIFAWDDHKTYDRATTWSHDIPCKTGSVYSYSSITAQNDLKTYGLVLTPTNGGVIEIGFWRRYSYTAAMSFTSSDLFLETFNRSESYNETITRGNGVSPDFTGDTFFTSEPGGEYGRSKTGDDTNWFSTPWTETGNDDFETDSWDVIWAGHYITDDDLLAYFFISNGPGDKQAFAAIGGDPDVEPSNVTKHTNATAALLALVELATSDELSVVYLK